MNVTTRVGPPIDRQKVLNHLLEMIENKGNCHGLSNIYSALNYSCQVCPIVCKYTQEPIIRNSFLLERVKKYLRENYTEEELAPYLEVLL